jgi:hypothetical protein
MSSAPPLRLSLFFLTLLLGGCLAARPDSQAANKASLEIRGKIDGIRRAILAKSAAGILQPATADWTFTGADGVTFDRPGFLTRTETLFARVIAIESLETQIDRLTFPNPRTAEIEITQTMVRSERAADSSAVTRLSLRYREHHTWVRTNDGWRVRRVQFIGTPERKVLPNE